MVCSPSKLLIKLVIWALWGSDISGICLLSVPFWRLGYFVGGVEAILLYGIEGFGNVGQPNVIIS